MATASPPSPPAAPPPPPPGSPGAARARARPSGRARTIAIGALALVVLIVAYLVFGGSGGASYQLEFDEAGQLVRGDQVQVGGVPVGSVTNIVLTHNYKAMITIHVNSSLAPLHQGTIAQVRVPSLASVANRYIALSPGPTAPRAARRRDAPGERHPEVVDLDKLFNTFNPKTLKGLQGSPGIGRTVRGPGRNLGISTEYFPPAWRRPTTSSTS